MVFQPKKGVNTPPYNYYIFCITGYTPAPETSVNLNVLPVVSQSPLKTYQPSFDNVVNLRLINKLGAGNILQVAPLFYNDGQIIADGSYLQLAGSASGPTYLNSIDPSFSSARVGYQDQLYQVLMTVNGATTSALYKLPHNINASHQYIGIQGTMINGEPTVYIELRDTSNTFDPKNIVY